MNSFCMIKQNLKFNSAQFAILKMIYRLMGPFMNKPKIPESMIWYYSEIKKNWGCF